MMMIIIILNSTQCFKFDVSIYNFCSIHNLFLTEFGRSGQKRRVCCFVISDTYHFCEIWQLSRPCSALKLPVMHLY